MDEKQPWEQQSGEPNLWFRRFEAFKRMGPKRSLLGAYNTEAGKSAKKQSVAGAWNEAYRKWEWLKRANAWDEQISREEEEKWQTRRDQLKNQEWDLSQALLEKAQKMLVFPLAETRNETTTTTDGKTVIHQTAIVPVRWGLKDVALLAAEASKLARLATGQATDKIDLTDWRAEAIKAGVPPDVLNAVYDEVVKKLAEQLAGRDAGRGDGGGTGEGE